MPDSFFDPTKGEIKGAELRAHLDELATFKAAEDSRKLTLPASPDAYQVALPEGFTPPVGVAYEFDTKNPALASAQQWAHANGLSQQQFSDMLALYASNEVASVAKLETLKSEHLKGLGVNGPARIDAVTLWLTSNFGEMAKPAIASMATTQQVEMFEKIIAKVTGQGGGGFRQTGREVDTGKVDDATYNKMSYAEKKAYAAKHSGQAA